MKAGFRIALIALLPLGVIGCDGAGEKPIDEPETATEEDEPTKLVIENPDGTVTLLSFLPMHLINHLRNALIQADYELIFEQLISERTKQSYRGQGHDPREIIDWFSTNRRDIILLLGRMSQGMNSPDTVWEQMGSVLRLRVVGGPAQALRFHTLDVTRENGQFKLVFID